MFGIVLAIAVCTAFYCGIRYKRLKRSIRELNQDLADITRQIEENRILKLHAPQYECKKAEAFPSLLKGRLQYQSIAHPSRSKSGRAKLGETG